MKPFFLADNILTNLTATSTAFGTDVKNILDRRPYTVWQGTSTAAQTITADCGPDRPADAIGISGHNLSGATVALESSQDAAAWTNRLTFAAGAEDIVKTFGPVTARYWRLVLTNLTATPYLGVVVLGTRLSLPRFPREFTPETITVEADGAKTKTGNLLGLSIRYTARKIQAEIPYPGNDWTENIFRPFFCSNTGHPVFFAWDADNWPRKSGLIRLSGKYAPSYDALGRVSSLSVEMEGVV